MKGPGITVWAMIPFDGRIKYKIYKETMNSERYLNVLNEIVVPTLTSMRYNYHQYQQDGASVHYAIAVRECLNAHLPGRWIGRGSAHSWPARSPDLSVADFFLWGYVRQEVFKEPRAKTLDELSTKVENVLKNINVDFVKKSFSNFIKRCEMCVNVDGKQFEQFL